MGHVGRPLGPTESVWQRRRAFQARGVGVASVGRAFQARRGRSGCVEGTDHRGRDARSCGPRRAVDERPAGGSQGRAARRRRSREEPREDCEPAEPGGLLRFPQPRRQPANAAGTLSEIAAAHPERAARPSVREFSGVRQLRHRVPGAHLFIGNFNGFNIYDIERPKKPKLAASTVCPGGQGDVSVHGNLLFMSVEQTRGRVDCGTQGVSDAGERRALPRRPHLRHHRRQASRSRSPPCRRAAARTRTRW